jgi:ADP-heptose:LPS heptosyltransferase
MTEQIADTDGHGNVRHMNSDRKIHITTGRRFAAYALGGICLTLRAATIWRRQSHRVLIYEPYGMGDILSLQPLVRLLCHKGLDVTVCGREPWKLLMPGDCKVQWVNACVPWAGYTIRNKYGNIPAVLSAMFRQIRALRPMATGSIGIDPRGDVRSILILRAAGCSRIISLSHYLGTDLPVLPGIAERLTLPTEPCRWKQNIMLAQTLNLPVQGDMLPPNLQYLAQAPIISPKMIGLIAVSPWPGKEWVPDHWRELESRLRNDGYNTVALCGPQQEVALEQVMGSSVTRVTCASVDAWCRQLAGLRAVVAVDSGPMHVAAALNVPTLALMGSSVVPLWSPASANSQVIHHQTAIPCAPCHQIGTCRHQPCLAMARITVDEVYRRLLSILHSNPPPGLLPSAKSTYEHDTSNI